MAVEEGFFIFFPGGPKVQRYATEGNCTVVMHKTDYDKKINISHNVFNYATFVDEIEDIHLDDDDIFVSFDILSVSLLKCLLMKLVQ